MKRILLNKKFLLPAVSFVVLLLVVLVLQLVYSFRAVKAAQQEQFLIQNKMSSAGWNNRDVNRLKKDILWYEQLMVMANNDSIGLVLNLRDSVVQINLKGLYLVQSQIIKQHPADFFKNTNEVIYKQFGSVNSIIEESANFPKKPVKKVIAYNPQEDKKDDENVNAVDKPLFWSFTTGNNINVVITGVEAAPDSSLSFFPVRDLIYYHFQDLMKQPVPEKYMPTLYLWLNDKDAKSIYRAVSSRGKVLFRN